MDTNVILDLLLESYNLEMVSIASKWVNTDLPEYDFLFKYNNREEFCNKCDFCHNKM